MEDEAQAYLSTTKVVALRFSFACTGIPVSDDEVKL
jgi:hypothetical protein